MVLVSYSRRILVDNEFIEWLSKSEHKSMAITRMLRIHQNSREHKKENIVILEKDFQELCNKKIIKDRDTIRGCLHRYDIYEEVGWIDLNHLPIELWRLIAGVILSKEKPYQVVLFTTKEGKERYHKYKDFLDKIKNLEIIDGEESLVILGNLFSDYASAKDLTR